MAGWDEILEEINTEEIQSQPDIVRRRYLKDLADYRGRNVIIYYSGWLKKGSGPNTDINDDDMEGFMNAVRGMDCTKGLDLLLHTPGGDPYAAEAIVRYLRDKFDCDITVIVPHLAMSAGTMIACAAREIVMGRHSSLGPIDPQFEGVPAYNLKKEYEEAERDLGENPEKAAFWAIRLQRYPAAFLYTVLNAIESSKSMLESWLLTNMLKEEYERDPRETNKTLERIHETLSDHSTTMSHNKHLGADLCRHLGLKVSMLEEDQEFQDKVLSVHHSAMITIGGTATVKIIENHLGKAYIVSSPE